MEVYYNEMHKNNQYDITVNATVTDVSQKPQGIYRVKTDNAEFEAYATAGDYYKNDAVLVQVPNGNYKNQKFILGRRTDESVANQTFHFKLPFDDFIGLRHLNRNEDTLSGRYWANYPSYAEEQQDILKILVWEWNNDGSSTIGNTRLGIEADWQTLLGHYQPLRGTYGFRIVIKGVSSATEESAAQTIEKTEYFTNRDMYGNTYAFFTPYTQQKVIDITDFLNIHSIQVYFYQDYGFVDGDNNTIIYTERSKTGEPLIPENILFSNVQVYIGISAADIKDETVLLHSYDRLGYTGIEELDEDGLPTGTWLCDENHELRMVWVHYEKDGTFSVVDNLEELLKQEKTSGKDTHIYWYRYDYKIENPNEKFFPGQKYNYIDGEYVAEIDDLGFPVFGEASDEYRYLAKDLMDSEINENYESKIERYAGSNYTFIPGMTDSFIYNIIPRGYKSREKFKVVIQHHGTHTTSTELILKNSRDVESEIAGNARNDAIIIKCFKLSKKLNDDGEWVDGDYIAVENGSLNAFYVYDENNNILFNEENERFDEHEYYLQIHCRDEDTSLYSLLETLDPSGFTTGSLISWAFPQSYTMIRSVMEVTENDAKYFEINPQAEPLRYENFHNATMKFTINSVLNNRYLDNTIGAVINRNGKEYHIEKAFQFGRAQSLGHEFLPVLKIIYPVGGTYLCNSGSAEFQIGCVVYNKDGSLYETPQTLTFSWKELSGQAKIINYGSDYNGDREDGYLIGSYHHRDDTISNEMDSHYREKYNKYKNNVVYGFLTSDSVPPIFEVTVHGAADYPLTVRKGFMICNNHVYKQSRDILVPDRVEFKSDGAAPIFYTNNFEVINLNDNTIEYPTWEISNDSILQLQSSTVARSTIAKTASGQTGTVSEEFRQYRLNFNSPQWYDGLLKPECYTYISFTDGDNVVAQAIAFDRNTYSSSLVNEWDGTSLTWNEEDGAILSTMIAAGSKDSSNRFTGVMMGDWHAKGDESLDVPGLYGYEKGAQSFGFKTDGSAFLGQSGRGRIEFDGNKALISNADKSCYVNLNPSVRDLSLNSLANTQSYSENFLYCEVDTAKNSFSDVTNGILGPDSWARQYMENTDKDFFVVNPNYGVVTSGGIIARYGALGNWMISDQGLYQKAAGKYMYLGYNPSKAEDPDSTDETTYAIYAGTDFGGDGNNPSYTKGINPYFSVTWDGTLFARKGKISNTWVIDDNSLTYEKNNGIIYIGAEEANPGRASSKDDPRNWAISASEKNDDNLINFGVSLSGELYAQLGTIAGWNFDDSEFYSQNSNMILSSNGYIYAGTPYKIDEKIYYPITIDANQGLLSIMNIVQDSEGNANTSGYIYLGNYNLESSSTSMWTIPTNISRVTKPKQTFLKEVKTDKYTSNRGWGENLAYQINNESIFETTGSILSTNVIKLTSSNTFNILTRDSAGSYGVSIVTGIDSTNGSKAIAVYPRNAANGFASLGTKENPWNIYSKSIYCSDLETAGALAAQTILMGEELVATEPWVIEQLNQVYGALNELGGSGGGMAGSIGGLSGGLADMATTQVDTEGRANGFMVLVGKNLDGGTIWISEEIPATFHNHKLDLSTHGILGIRGPTTMGDSSTEIPLTHAHTGEAIFNEDGTITITLDTGTFNTTTPSTITSNSIEATAWYRSRAYGSTYLQGSGDSAYIGVYSKNGATLSTYSLKEYYNSSFGDGYAEGYEQGYDWGYSSGLNAASCSEKHISDIESASMRGTSSVRLYFSDGTYTTIALSS